MATIQVNGLVFDFIQEKVVLQEEEIDEDEEHFQEIENKTFDDMIFFKDSLYIPSSEKKIYQICVNWYFYIHEYASYKSYDDYIIFLHFNEFYLSELKKEFQEIRERTITLNPNEFQTYDNIFNEMDTNINYLQSKDRIIFDIAEMMKLIHEFVGEYFQPY